MLQNTVGHYLKALLVSIDFDEKQLKKYQVINALTFMVDILFVDQPTFF